MRGMRGVHGEVGPPGKQGENLRFKLIFMLGIELVQNNQSKFEEKNNNNTVNDE